MEGQSSGSFPLLINLLWCPPCRCCKLRDCLLLPLLAKAHFLPLDLEKVSREYVKHMGW